MEGGFSKVLLMQKENGMEVIAKIPCRIAGPAVLTTECEVGVLEFCMRFLGHRAVKLQLLILSSKETHEYPRSPGTVLVLGQLQRRGG